MEYSLSDKTKIVALLRKIATEIETGRIPIIDDKIFDSPLYLRDLANALSYDGGRSVCLSCELGDHADSLADLAVHEGIVKCDCMCHILLRS